MSAVEVIERAIEIIVERGWCQRKLVDDDGRVCASEALRLAMLIYPQPMVAVRVAVRLRRAAGFGRSAGVLVDWNDHPGRTVENVVSTLKRAAAGGRLCPSP
jgi:hypothetical protein